ncbi:MAG TPA: dihydroorotate dehydrogenase (quinone), partial [Hyphomicrobiaceae bacterium]|nr:dihydroorotate dehydrogenase (quinone) [Hyphomicrobiaceae bacterium]
GNPTPRVFRLIRDRGAINRLGFNNAGHNRAAMLLARRSAQAGQSGIVGVNIGANKYTEDKAADYVRGLDVFYDHASYFMINISSPNTPGLRDLQAPAALDDLLGRIMARRNALVEAGRPRKAIVVKIAPDVAEDDLPAICERIVAHDADALAVSNTTLARPSSLDPLFAREAGGLSGRPLFHRSTAMLARAFGLVGDRLPLIGIGGIDSGATALAKIEAGASLIQLYTGLIYEGPALIDRIKSELVAGIERTGTSHISELVGRRAGEWAAKSIDG